MQFRKVLDKRINKLPIEDIQLDMRKSTLHQYINPPYHKKKKQAIITQHTTILIWIPDCPIDSIKYINYREHSISTTFFNLYLHIQRPDREPRFYKFLDCQQVCMTSSISYQLHKIEFHIQTITTSMNTVQQLVSGISSDITCSIWNSINELALTLNFPNKLPTR